MKVSRRETIDRYYLFKFFGYGLFIHRIHHSDPAGVYHTHPWSAVSFIFGSYTEYTLGGLPKVKTGFNLLKAKVPHRVILHKGPVWTVFIHGRRSNEWKVFDEVGEVVDVEPWRGVGGRTTYLPEESTN